MAADLKSFLEAQRAQQAASDGIDWDLRRKRWLTELGKVLAWVRDTLVAAGLEPAAIRGVTHGITEQRLGSYEAPGLQVDLPSGMRVSFVPVASVILGGFGRIDVIGPGNGRPKLIAEDAKADRPANDRTPSYERQWAWRVYPGPGHRESFPLDEQGLTQLLTSITA